MSVLQELQRNWEGLAQTNPLWAICTDPEKRQGQWSRDEFFATGKHEIERVMGYVNGLRLRVDRSAPALDFGCGVGRLTRAMAAYFPECWGVDISPTMVRLATEYNQNVPQCCFLLNESSDLKALAAGYFGFVYTSIVLQHIPARYSRRYLRELLRVTRPGGVVVFQVLDSFRAGVMARWRQKIGVRRRLRRLLAERDQYFMDSHVMEEWRVRRLIESAEGRIVDVCLTNSAERSFNGKLEYLSAAPVHGYVSKQYCVVKQCGTQGKARLAAG